MLEDDCIICANSFNKSIRKKVKCQYCDFTCCATCLRTSIITSFKDPCCINPDCKKNISKEFLQTYLPKKFLNTDFKKHRENILFEREKALIPNTMEYVQRDIEAEKIETNVFDLQKQLEIAKQNVITLKCEINRGYTEARNIRLGYVRNENTRKKFIKKCPVDNCKGFLSSRWKCAICNVNVCSECHEIKNETTDHICKEDNVRSAKIIANDCKNCPNCNVFIYKIEGCDQMWCTECQTPFSWKTGEIVSGVVHNPHYFQFMRNNGGVPRQIGDVQCGGIPGWYAVNSKIRYNTSLSKEQSKIISNFHRLTLHISQVEIPIFREMCQVNDMTNLDLRKKYIRNRIEENIFKTTLYRKENERERSLDILQVFETFINVSTDLLLKFIDNDLTYLSDMNILINEINSLVVFCNDAFQKIALRYSVKAYNLNIKENRIYRI